MEVLRKARREDAWAIRMLIYRVGINPMGLDWRRFMVIVDERERLLACGQVKPHRDGTRELASLAVQEGYRGRGLARRIIAELQDQNGPPLHLMCASPLQPFYRKYGFRSLLFAEIPPSLKGMVRVVNGAGSLFGRPDQLAIMLWENLLPVG